MSKIANTIELIPQYLEIAVALPVYKTYTYKVPANLSKFVSVGKRVLVSFGKRTVTGYILCRCENKTENEIKPILDILDDRPIFPLSMTSFFQWISDYYMHPIGDVIKNALPGGINLYDFVYIHITEKGKKFLAKNAGTLLENEILLRLQQGKCRHKNLCGILNKNIPHSIIYSFERRGLVVLKKEMGGGKTRSKTERFVSLGKNNAEINNIKHASCSKAEHNRNKAVKLIEESGELSLKKIKDLTNITPHSLKLLEKNGRIKIYEKKVCSDPFGENIRYDKALKLTYEQKTVVSKVKNLIGKGFATCLLFGVTGSGKTEVYLQLAKETIKKGESVLVLVPEIALISQTERRFRSRFGQCVAVLHSGLSPRERYDQWMRISLKKASIAIGARSAIFAPFDNIGLIIVDEEHDTSYKQESTFCYNARDLAIVRAKQNNCVALLGSATPSVQSYYNVTKKKYTVATLENRVEQRPLPEISIIDLRKNRDEKGIRQFITPQLYSAMKKTLDRGEQVLLFLNQRGFASQPICASCSEPVRCKNCSITLTMHKKTNSFMCHYCGFLQPASSHCMTCGSHNIKLLGFGTEKVEAAINAFFPDANVARMDRDTTVRKGSTLKILKSLKNRSVDVLIGTQIVAKGHDFANITLVGIICADLSLNFPDFRAAERTFQLLAQVAGRAGRGDVPGKVLLQTYNPNHFSIIAAQNQDFVSFYNREIEFRKALNYPPFSRMIQLKITGSDREKTVCHAKNIGKLCRELKKTNRSYETYVKILGPIEAPIPMIAKKHRWQIFLKSARVKPLQRFVRELLFKNSSTIKKNHVKVTADVDPFFMM